MNETEFLGLSAEVLHAIERHADAWQASHGVDIETELNGCVLTLTFEDDSQIVVNSQAAMQEIWLAARSGGFHYRYDAGRWRDSRGGPDLAEALSQLCSEATGQVLSMRF